MNHLDIPSRIVLLAAAFIVHPSSFILGQGSLTPPGAPAPTMKTLDQVEARMDVQKLAGDGSSQFLISQPGSYYLTANITGVSGKNGISINASNVTLDLNGFALIGVAGSLAGIRNSTGLVNVAIANGAVRSWGGAGINLTAGGVTNTGRLSALRVRENGGTGVSVGTGFTIDSCSSENNGANGIVTFAHSTIQHCVARNNGGNGISSSEGVISGCVINDNAGSGISGSNGSIQISGCSLERNHVDGIVVGERSTVLQNTVFASTAVGISVTANCVVSDNFCVQANGAAGVGIRAEGSRNRITRNHLATNTVGLLIDTSGNVISDNTVQGGTDNYNIVAGNQFEILLCQIPESIDWPAHVKLAGTLTGSSGQNGITIASDDVTVDLGGHALVGVAGSLKGIVVSGFRSNFVVRNGTVRSWGGDGIDASASINGQFDRLQLSNNGGRGMNIGDRALVTDCAAKQNNGHGIFGGIINTVSRCEAALNSGFGISVSETCQIEKCNLNNNTGGGISVANNCAVRENNCDFHTTATGILVTGSRNRIDGNHLTRNQTGITLTVSSANNTVIRNSASGSTGAGSFPAPNYSINGTGNDLGPVGPAATATSPWANLSF